ncbi:pseudouridine synthase [Psychroflexus sp. CAK8W]|uniref:Pseudouridine synthase n=1 Tax=Psychroflexus longus TaxID=2873596 RepID=A0ABS7XLF7_9FLAO|nr:pseudouridine synthase [Psychroflexus longus]MBZ9779334.1 pseudouridine synthase [Psychroflexus longus]
MANFKIFKPYGMLSQFVNNEKRRRNKRLLGELGDFPEGIMSVGRLDQDSEGLLFLTTDGKFSHKITSTGIEKEYWAQVDGEATEEHVAELSKGVEISIYGKPYYTKSCEVRLMTPPDDLPRRAKDIRNEDEHGRTSWLSITLTEGKYRQVRKMTAKVGLPTLRLIRYRIGEETIENMKPEEIRDLI